MPPSAVLRRLPFAPVMRTWPMRILSTVALVCVGCGGATSDVSSSLVDGATLTVTDATVVATTAPIAVPTVAVPTATPVPPPTPTPPVPTPATAPTRTVAAAPTASPTSTTPPVVDDAAPATAETEAAATPEAAREPDPTPAPTAEPTVEVTAPQAVASTEIDGREVTSVGYVTLGRAGDVLLVIPAASVELVGFHEAGHPGSQPINAAASGLSTMVLDTRSRNTSPTSAADIVIPPGEQVRAPATGTVIAANEYILYCEHTDKLVYIEPDGLPGWQVRVFHVAGATPPVGTRVVAGETVIAEGARLLPFESQVDEFTGEPSWGHVHVEVVDTNVPDDRPPGPGCP